MSMTEENPILAIRTVANGFYEGFNPVVSMVTKMLIALLVTALVAYPLAAGEMIGLALGISCHRDGQPMTMVLMLASVSKTMFLGWREDRSRISRRPAPKTGSCPAGMDLSAGRKSG